MNLDLIIPQNYSIGEIDVSGSRSLPIASESEITPQTYLEFAIQDFMDNQGNRSKVNAFANAKRAIHFQTDIISEAFGINQLPKKDRTNFQKKIYFCEKCGTVGKRILGKYNKIRNKVEHNYYHPQEDEVESIIDIAQLFLAATARYITMFPSDLEVELIPKTGGSLPTFDGIELPVGEGVIYLHERSIIRKKNTDGSIDIIEWRKQNSVQFSVRTSKQYFEWVKVLVSVTQ
jgi:hypothetical protein